MDTTDPNISFDNSGVCNHCQYYSFKAKERLRTGESGRQELNALVEKIKRHGEGKQYDCVLGVSGGVDSTYVAYTVKELGLRPLAVHLDNGWNSELAVRNIEGAVGTLDIDLYTHVVNWPEFRSLQLSFLRASVPEMEVPTDHGISALLYQVSRREKIRYIMTGVNVTTEGIHPTAWGYGMWDWRYISGVHQRYGECKLTTYPSYRPAGLLYYAFLAGIRRIAILNYIDYVKEDAIDLLTRRLDWRYYGGKHYESIYTRFVQGYILPRKFSIDKRRAHLSSLICAGQMTRDEALKRIEAPPYLDPALEQHDREYVIKKLGITEADFEGIMRSPPKSVRDYPSYCWAYPAMRYLANRLGFIRYL